MRRLAHETRKVTPLNGGCCKQLSPRDSAARAGHRAHTASGIGGNRGGVFARPDQALGRDRTFTNPIERMREVRQMYAQRYVPHLPAAGEIVIFDRSWYNRAGVECVMGFCTKEEAQEFLHVVPRRADPASAGAYRRSAQDLETLADGSEILRCPQRRIDRRFLVILRNCICRLSIALVVYSTRRTSGG
jgi:Polyphosphate kinase 2 (PPK2)